MLVHSIILGIVQGLTEFLPISSSAHLVIIPKFFNWKELGLSFDIALHIGTLLALLLFFWKEWVKLAKSFFNSIFKLKINSSDEKLSWLIVLASIPSAIGAYFLESKAESVFRSPTIIAITLIIFGLILYFSDIYSKNSKNMGKIRFQDAIFIGICQIVAVIPGSSRSGITISAGRLAKLDRESAVKFSFLLSAPIILGAAITHIGQIENQFNSFFLAGLLSSFISGYIAIALLMNFIKKNNFLVFLIYRIIFALLIIAVLI
ncbi:MAG: undecaprenyl-diphosphatase UppP [Patescibacteria group bacterium]|jgi:undecaprenyl-diphosphatase